MNMSTIAEGVETEETAELLEQMNVDALQGYLISRSMPVEAIPSWRAIWMAGDTTDAPRIEPVSQPGGADQGGALSPANDRAPGSETPPPVAPASLSDTRTLTPSQTEEMQLLTPG